MGVTPNGLRYIDPDQPIRLVAQYMQWLAEDVDALIAADFAPIIGVVHDADGDVVPGYRYRIIIDPLNPLEVADIIVEAI